MLKDTWNSFNIYLKITVVVLFLILIGSVISLGKNRISNFFQEHEVESIRATVNLEPDIGFIDCVRIQHACLYDHINKKQFNTILEDCKSENYCNNTFK
jgi:CMP-2-keto-3-deoxyoctulosonic acid synthetase